jgi:hypothetical protein
MTQWRRFLLRLVNVFRSARPESELGREIGAHVGLLEDEYLRGCGTLRRPSSGSACNPCRSGGDTAA